MPTKTWEPVPQQSDTDIDSNPARSAEPRNFEPAHRGAARNPDVPSETDPDRPDYCDTEEINTHGSER